MMINKMSFNIAQSETNHNFFLLETIKDWKGQDPDVELLSSDGVKISSHRSILSFYSKQMKQLLNDPVIAFGCQLPLIFIPETSSSIFSLLDLLTTGQTIASESKDQEKVIETAKVLGIALKNCILNQDEFSKGTRTRSSLNTRNPRVDHNWSNLLSLFQASTPNKVIENVENIEEKSEEIGLIISNIKSEPENFDNEEEEKSDEIGLMISNIKSEAVDDEAPRNRNILENNIEDFDEPLEDPVSITDVNIIESITDDFEEPMEDTAESYTDVKSEENDDDWKPTLSSDVHPGFKVSYNSSGLPICDVCKSEFKQVKYLLRHNRRIHGIRLKPRAIIKCQLCPASFSNSKLLEKHMKRHSEAESNKHICNVCFKSFKQQRHLKQHQVTHLPDAEKPYECEICHKKFSQTGQRRVHINKYHGGQDNLYNIPIKNQDFNSLENADVTPLENDDVIPKANQDVIPQGNETAESKVENDKLHPKENFIICS